MRTFFSYHDCQIYNDVYSRIFTVQFDWKGLQVSSLPRRFFSNNANVEFSVKLSSF